MYHHRSISQVQLTLWLDRDWHVTLKALAATENLSCGGLIRKALHHYQQTGGPQVIAPPAETGGLLRQLIADYYTARTTPLEEGPDDGN